MADISKCRGKGCALKEICYRYTCPGDELWQSYTMVDESLKPGDTHCEMFWPDRKEEDEIKRVYGKRKRKTSVGNSATKKHSD